MVDDFIAALKTECNTSATAVIGADFRRVSQLLLERFFGNVKRATGNWVYNDYRWHGYSFGHEKAVSGDRAFELYRGQPIGPFYIYHEFDDALFDCIATAWPDVRCFDNDIYVFPHNFNWLFTTTHEMSIGLGPYFAEPST